MVEEEYPSGRKVKNEFESDGDISRIYGNATPSATERTYANTFSYTPDGRIEKLRLGNGLWEKAKFNSRLQVTEMAVGNGVNSGNLWKLGYEYGEIDGNGNVDTAKNTGNVARQTLSFNGLTHPFVQTYKYDSLYRLTEARETSNGTQTWKQNFSYDRYGNRLTHDKFSGTNLVTQTNITHPAINPNTNRFASGQGFTFDKNGNLIVDADGRQFTFNGDNKQTQVKDVSNNVVGTYFYDGEGKRIKKVSATETTVFVYSAGKLIAEYSTATPSSNPTTSWTVTDQLGSPRVIVNSLGAVVSRRDFMPFGEELDADETYRTTGQKYGQTDSVRQKFTGYQKDEETGLDFAENRMYQNLHGRFTAIDPLLASGKSRDPQTFNRYVYVLNNPLVLTDPDGLQVATATGKVYQRGNRFRIFDGSPSRGFKPVTRTINTTTTIRGVAHHLTIRPGGWEVGSRVDNVKFEAKAPPATQTRSDISAMAGEVVRGLIDARNGILKGIANAPSDALNGATSCLLNCGIQGFYFQGSNPLAVPRIFDYGNAREASYGTASSTGTLFGLGAAGGTIFGASSRLSVVPEANTSTTLFRAVSRAELDDIASFGFRSNPTGRGYQEVKLFATSADDAAQFGRNNYGLDGVPNFIVQTEASPAVMSNSLTTTMDSMSAVSVPSNQLNLLRNVRVCNFSPTCR